MWTLSANKVQRCYDACFQHEIWLNDTQCYFRIGKNILESIKVLIRCGFIVFEASRQSDNSNTVIHENVRSRHSGLALLGEGCVPFIKLGQ